MDPIEIRPATVDDAGAGFGRDSEEQRVERSSTGVVIASAAFTLPRRPATALAHPPQECPRLSGQLVPRQHPMKTSRSASKVLPKDRNRCSRLPLKL